MAWQVWVAIVQFDDNSARSGIPSPIFYNHDNYKVKESISSLFVNHINDI